MKLRHLFFFPVLLVFILSLSACSSDEAGEEYTPPPSTETPPASQPDGKKMLPSRIDYTWEDPDWNIERMSSYTLLCTYDDEGRFTKITMDYKIIGGRGGKYTYTFSYKGDAITIQAKQNTEAFSTMTLVRKGLEVFASGYSTSVIKLDKDLRSTSYTYDNHGNVSKYKGVQTYDNKKGILSDVNMPFWFMTDVFFEDQLGKGNIVNNVVKAKGDDWEDVLTYTYNAADYPTDVNISTTSQIILPGDKHPTPYISIQKYKITYIEVQ